MVEEKRKEEGLKWTEFEERVGGGNSEFGGIYGA